MADENEQDIQAAIDEMLKRETEGTDGPSEADKVKRKAARKSDTDEPMDLDALAGEEPPVVEETDGIAGEVEELRAMCAALPRLVVCASHQMLNPC